MALTNEGKRQSMLGLTSDTRYISLHTADNTELSGNGYARAAITSSQMSVAANGRVTGPANHPVYTANTDTAIQAVKLALYDAATGGNQLLEPENITSPPPAPVNGQQVQITMAITP